MPLIDLLAPDRVAILPEAGDRDAVLDAAARLLSGATPGQASELGQRLRQREAIGTTAIGHGVAIPHARDATIDCARGAFLRLDVPVDFDAGDGVLVDLVFAMGVPEHSTQQHLQALSELADSFADAGFRQALRGAPDLPALRSLLDRPRPQG
jgi:nitrogen PTS system EIIA component